METIRLELKKTLRVIDTNFFSTADHSNQQLRGHLTPGGYKLVQIENPIMPEIDLPWWVEKESGLGLCIKSWQTLQEATNSGVNIPDFDFDEED